MSTGLSCACSFAITSFCSFNTLAKKLLYRNLIRFSGLEQDPTVKPDYKMPSNTAKPSIPVATPPRLHHCVSSKLQRSIIEGVIRWARTEPSAIFSEQKCIYLCCLRFWVSPSFYGVLAVSFSCSTTLVLERTSPAAGWIFVLG